MSLPQIVVGGDLTLLSPAAEDERKLLCQLLPKLYIPEEIADLQVKSLLWLIASLKVVSGFVLTHARSRTN